MNSIYFSEAAFSALGNMNREDAIRMIAVLERIIIRPGRYLRKMKNDPAYRMSIDRFNIYIDLVLEDISVLLIKEGHRRVTGDSK